MTKRTTTSHLRQKLTLQNEMKTADGAGGYTRSWQNVADVWAEVMPVSGREKLYAMQLESSVTHRVRIRARTGVSSGQRLISDGLELHIVYVASIQNGEMIEMMAEEKKL